MASITRIRSFVKPAVMSPDRESDPQSAVLASEDEEEHHMNAEDDARGLRIPTTSSKNGTRNYSPGTSPVSRAGLLSYRPSSSRISQVHPVHNAEDTRDDTLQLSTMPDTPKRRPKRHSSDMSEMSGPVGSFSSSTLSISNSFHPVFTPGEGSSRPALLSPPFFNGLDGIRESNETRSGDSTPRPLASPTLLNPSGLSLLLAQKLNSTPAAQQVESHLDQPTSSPPILRPSNSSVHESNQDADEATELVHPNAQVGYGATDGYFQTTPPPTHITLKERLVSSVKGTNGPTRRTLKDVRDAVPAVLLGMLLNVLDGVSYGMIIFPATAMFQGFEGIGVSMFFVTAIISQVIYTVRSSFAGANGSMMIEVVPFFHIIVQDIIDEVGDANPDVVISTTMIAFAISSILTGATFLLLGYFKLGIIIGFFPRHTLVGCIGGVGVFLVITGLEVCARVPDGTFNFSLSVIEMFISPKVLMLWLPALALAVLLRVITHRYHHQLILPVYFMIIPIVFYIVVAAAHLSPSDLRQQGWVFSMGATSTWWKFWTYFDLRKTSGAALLATLPTQFALLFFNILHPPLNVPALAVSLDEDVDTNTELVAHGYSNILAGLLGTVPNYLVYVNTLLFYRVNGGTRVAGVLLAIGNVILLVIGTGPIGYIPIMVVGALIFVLGIDLIKEALYDTRERTTRIEYITIISIMVVMTFWDFVTGVIFGIIMNCFFFVVQNSQRRSIRAIYSGELALSTVRRPSVQRDYLREVARQTQILRLQGFLFFGTIVHVEDTIRQLLDTTSWKTNPIRFLVVDLTLVGGIDLSSAEAFVRLQKLLAGKNAVLVFCGTAPPSPTYRALQSVKLLQANNVEIFPTLNEAIEWTENWYLRTWYLTQRPRHDDDKLLSIPQGRSTRSHSLQNPLASTPRVSHLRSAAVRTIAQESPSTPQASNVEPLSTLKKAFSAYGAIDAEYFKPLIDALERVLVPEGVVLWKIDDDSDGLYLIESGILKARYHFTDSGEGVEECMLAGTLAGELTALSSTPRNTSAVAERDAILWKLSKASMQSLETDHPAVANAFVKLVLKATRTETDNLLAALSARR